MTEENTGTTSNESSKEVKNSSNDYTPYYSDIIDDHRMSTDTPDVYIMVSKQKRGTETAATPYTSQEDSDNDDDSSSQSNNNTSSNNSNTTSTS